MTLEERVASKIQSLEIIFGGLLVVGIILTAGGVGVFGYMLATLS